MRSCSFLAIIKIIGASQLVCKNGEWGLLPWAYCGNTMGFEIVTVYNNF